MLREKSRRRNMHNYRQCAGQTGRVGISSSGAGITSGDAPGPVAVCADSAWKAGEGLVQIEASGAEQAGEIHFCHDKLYRTSLGADSPESERETERAKKGERRRNK